MTGESGTGKELVADALHAAGNRCDKNLVKINCAALSEGLLESELFGHVRGAFTGAVRDKVGRFQRADRGTIFLDEIGEMTPAMQLRLLRVLETMEFERVGDSTPITVDVRVIAATNRDLQQKVKGGEFREDLYLPPQGCRDQTCRRSVIGARTSRSSSSTSWTSSTTSSPRTSAGFRNRSWTLFMMYHWPGNIRQLENILEHAFVLCRQNIITPRDLPIDFMSTVDSLATDRQREMMTVPQKSGPSEKPSKQTEYNKSEAARLLGISRRTLYRKLEQHKSN